jgi:hypothetical protein
MNIIIKHIFVLLTLNFLCSSWAGAADSAWLLCDNGHIAVHCVEHRSKDGAGRVNSFSFIAGLHVLFGDLKNRSSGHIVLSSKPANETNFDGEISVDYTKQRLTLKGELQLNGKKVDLDSKLSCKKMTLTFD